MAATKGLNFNLGARLTGQSAFSSFQRALSAITAAGNSAKVSMAGVSKGVKSAADSASVFGPLLDNIDRLNRAFRDTVDGVHGVGREMRSAADSASVFDTEFNRLQAKFNPAAAALQKLAQSESELTRAMRLGVINLEQYNVQVRELRNASNVAAAAQRQLAPAVNSLGSAIDAHNRSVGSWNRGLKDTNRAIQQAGFQVGDFFIQVAGGQSIVLAFTQQAGQLIQFFGMWGSLAAAAIAIGGALWTMFGKGENATKKAGDALQSLNGALSGFGRNAEITSTTVEELRKTYGQWAEEVKATAQALLSVNLAQSVTALREGAMDATAALSEVFEAQKIANEIKKDQSNLGSDVTALLYRDQMLAVEGLASSLGMTATQANELYLAIGKMNGSTTWLEMQSATSEVSETLKRIYGTSIDVPPAIQEMWLKYGEVNTVLGQNLAIIDGTAAAAREVKDEVGETSEAASRLGAMFANVIPSINAVVASVGNGTTAVRTMVNAQPGQSWLGTAMYRMDTLAAKAWAAASAVASAMSGSVQSVGIGGAGRPEGIDIDPDARGAVMLARIQIMQKAAADAAAALGNVGGGSGGGAAPVEAITAQVTEATTALNEMKSVADSISQSFMTAFSGVLKGTKSVKDAAMDMLNTVLDKTIELLMTPVFDGIAGFLGKSIFGAVGSLGPVPSFDGGGSTGSGARSGGLDGKGGFLSIMHPKETVTDHTRGGGGMSGGGVVINVMVDGATGNGEIMDMVSRGVTAGLQHYDAKVLPQSLKRVSANPRRM